jgi:putative intracellular protease/amidase/YHS domain-containing protein
MRQSIRTTRPDRRSHLRRLTVLGLLVLLLVPTLARTEEEPVPLALKGLDPVLLVRGEEVEGSEDLAVTHRGFEYRFSSAETRAAFEAEPERYRIQNRTCPVSPGAKIDPALFAVHDGKIWAFASEGCVEEFKLDPDLYAEDILEYDWQAALAPPLRKVALVVYPGVELLDFAGPGEVFAAAKHGRAFEVFTVGASREPITSQGFVQVTPAHTFADAPKPDVVVVPGGGVRSLIDDPAAMDWLRHVSGEAEVVMSVCNGAFVLGRAGLLDGLEATTHHNALEALRRAVPTATVHGDRRFVDNGHVVTAAGVSAGIDASLHLVARLLGDGEARQAARYMEYPWVSESGETAGSTPRTATLSGSR